jgi:hypothetical protein
MSLKISGSISTGPFGAPTAPLPPGFVGSRAPIIRGALPLLGPAAGSVGLSETHVSDESFPAWDWLCSQRNELLTTQRRC